MLWDHNILQPTSARKDQGDLKVYQDLRVHRVCKATEDPPESQGLQVHQDPVGSQDLQASQVQMVRRGEMVSQAHVDPRGIRDHQDLQGCPDSRD